jgi:hypothetical protein
VGEGCLDRGVEGLEFGLGEALRVEAFGLDGGEFGGVGAEHGQVDPLQSGFRAVLHHRGAVFAVGGDVEGVAHRRGLGDQGVERRVKGGLAAGEVHVPGV